ncbi:MAG: zf-TFIIB domain-containing protein [Phycisphaeraceae bacterium]|nr:zf-TFIIB domain-containing protein [Phycisphaeraceae bacterium]
MGQPSSDRVWCPKCLVAMECLKLGRVSVDRCARCGGLWLDAGELSYLVADRDVPKRSIRAADGGPAKDQRLPNALGQMICPRDKSPMDVRSDARQSHVEYEVCPSCGGVFLDPGELTDLNEFTLKERLSTVLGRG